MDCRETRNENRGVARIARRFCSPDFGRIQFLFWTATIQYGINRILPSIHLLLSNNCDFLSATRWLECPVSKVSGSADRAE